MMEKLKLVISDAAKYSIYVMLILALIQPFGIDTIKEGRILFILGQTCLCFVCIVIGSLLYNVVIRRSAGEESFRKSLVHVFLLILISIPMMGAALLTFNSWFNTGNPFCYWMSETGEISLIGFLTMTTYVSCISIIIAIIAIYKSRNDNLRKRLEEVEKMNELLELRQEKMEKEEERKEAESKKGREKADNKRSESRREGEKNEAGKEETIEEVDASESMREEPIVKFIGQGQNAILQLLPSNLIYVESMANYADICYISENEIRHSTLRITLKQVRETLASVNYIAQCHRAFLVNINFVLKFSERNSGYQLQLFGIEKQIPVSRANTETIKEKLTSGK